jgi:hypothetical protein
MWPIQVDPSWYERFWLTDSPRPRRRPLGRHVARLAVAVALLAGGSAVLSYLDAHHDASGFQDWEQE